jgi:hypothetical protein
MASITRTNSTTPFAVGAYVQTSNVGAYIITVKNSDNNVQDLRTATGSLEAIEMLVSNLNVLGYTITNSGAGTISVLVDNSQHDANSIQDLVRNFVNADRDDSTENLGFGGSTVAAATTVTVA